MCKTHTNAHTSPDRLFHWAVRQTLVGHESIYSCPHLCCDRMRPFILSGSPVVRADAGVAASIIPYPSTLFKYFGDLRPRLPQRTATATFSQPPAHTHPPLSCLTALSLPLFFLFLLLPALFSHAHAPQSRSRSISASQPPLLLQRRRLQPPPAHTSPHLQSSE